MVLVLDLAEGSARVTEELWPDTGARRLMVWGRFDQFIAGIIPAKELRAESELQARYRHGAATEDEQKEYVELVLKRLLPNGGTGGI